MPNFPHDFNLDRSTSVNTVVARSIIVSVRSRGGGGRRCWISVRWYWSSRCADVVVWITDALGRWSLLRQWLTSTNIFFLALIRISVVLNEETMVTCDSGEDIQIVVYPFDRKQFGVTDGDEVYAKTITELQGIFDYQQEQHHYILVDLPIV